MQQLSRGAPRALPRPSARTLLPLNPHRLSYSSQGGPAPNSDPHTSHTTTSTTTGSQSGEESFGKGFWLALAALPSAYIIYQLSRGDQSNGFVSRLVGRYNLTKEELAERNALHTRMVEQAAHDRNLFVNSRMPNYVDLKMPEQITNMSPYNVPAGHSINLDKLIKHYQEKNYAEEEEKRRLFREGNLPVQVKERERLEKGRASAQMTGLAEVGGKGA